MFLQIIKGGIELKRRNNHTANGCGMGYLPGSAPLANPYVPFQKNNPPRYDQRKAWIRGTLFPGLDLPFMNYINNQEKPVTPLTELQSVAFAIQELALYLDTHSQDTEAFAVYSQLQELYRQGCQRYEAQYGPLNHFGDGQKEYRWLQDPWPWEYAANKEG